MKKHLAFALSLLMIALMPLTLSYCGNKYDDALNGIWQLTAYTLESGEEASIENDLFLVFYGNGYGETKTREETYHTFQYTARRGDLTRVIDYGKGEAEEVAETYRIEEDGTLVIVSPETSSAPAATMRLKKVESTS